MMSARTPFAIMVLALSASACSKSEPSEPPAEKAETKAAEPVEPTDQTLATAKALFGALPTDAFTAEGHEITPEKVALGRTLYFDPRLSKNHDISCATCHALDHFGVDPRPEAMEQGSSPGHRMQLGGRNSPTSLNAALQFAQFWDGRAADVEEQAKGPVLNPVEMAMKDEASVVAVLESIPGYEPMFEAAFGKDSPITFDHMAEAIGAFERKLVTPAPFDAYLNGDSDAISEEAKAGLSTFIAKGCTACHSGPGVGGQIYQKLGLVKPFETEDMGRHGVTQKEEDKFFFKVPTLRNVAKTAPYFHDGKVKTLEQAVRLMALHQTGSGELSDAEVKSIVSFLDTLTGKLPEALVAAPELPESGPNTPKPDPS